VAEGRDLSNTGLSVPEQDHTFRQLVLYKKNFGWVACWKLKSEVLESIWLMASVSWGEGEKVTVDEDLNEWGTRDTALLNYTLTFALELRTTKETTARVTE
jgi:hypothetical protein